MPLYTGLRYLVSTIKWGYSRDFHYHFVLIHLGQSEGSKRGYFVGAIFYLKSTQKFVLLELYHKDAI
jgi:hypothetical protein